MRIDVYDFDGTIYDGDSTVDFTLFCLRRHPGVLAGLPKFLGTSLLLAVGRRKRRLICIVFTSFAAYRITAEEHLQEK